MAPELHSKQLFIGRDVFPLAKSKSFSTYVQEGFDKFHARIWRPSEGKNSAEFRACAVFNHLDFDVCYTIWVFSGLGFRM